MLFPAGRLARRDKHGALSDPPWAPTPVSLARKYDAPIVPIHVGDAAKAFEFSNKLFEAGVFAPAVGYPTVAEGKARLRAIVSAGHKNEQLVKAADILAEVAKPLGILPA